MPMPVGREIVRPDVDVELRAVAADDVHLRHAGNATQIAADRLIGELRELRRRQGGRRQRDRDDRQRVGIESLNDRLEDLRRQLRPHGRDRVANVLRRLVHVFREDELDDDLREPVGRRRVELVDAADARELVLESRHDLALDDVGRRAGIGDADEDDRLVEIGELVRIQPRERREPEHDESDHRDDRDDRSLDGEVGNEHGWYAS